MLFVRRKAEFSRKKTQYEIDYSLKTTLTHTHRQKPSLSHIQNAHFVNNAHHNFHTILETPNTHKNALTIHTCDARYLRIHTNPQLCTVSDSRVYSCYMHNIMESSVGGRLTLLYKEYCVSEANNAETAFESTLFLHPCTYQAK